MQNLPYASHYGRNKVELKTKYILFKIDFTFEPPIGKGENVDLDHFTSEPFIYVDHWLKLKI